MDNFGSHKGAVADEHRDRLWIGILDQPADLQCSLVESLFQRIATELQSGWRFSG